MLGRFWGVTCVDSAYLLRAHCRQWNWKAQDKDGEDKPKSCEGKPQSSEDKQLKDSEHKQNKAVKTSKKGREDKLKKTVENKTKERRLNLSGESLERALETSCGLF